MTDGKMKMAELFSLNINFVHYAFQYLDVFFYWLQNSCAMNCLEKYLKMTQRISERFREHQLLSAEDPAAALQGMAPK